MQWGYLNAKLRIWQDDKIMDFCISGREQRRMIRSFEAGEGLKMARNQWFSEAGKKREDDCFDSRVSIQYE